MLLSILSPLLLSAASPPATSLGGDEAAEASDQRDQKAEEGPPSSHWVHNLSARRPQPPLRHAGGWEEKKRWEEIEEMGLNEPQQPDPQTMALVENLNSQTQKNMSDIQEAQIEMEKTQAETMKILADAEAQNLENDLIESGVMELLQDGDV